MIKHKKPVTRRWASVRVPDPASGSSIVVHVGRDLRINKHDLEKECREQAGRFAWYAQLYARAEAAAENAEQEAERVLAKMTRLVADREAGRSAKERRPHTAQRQEAMLSSRVVAAQKRAREARALKSELKLLLEAFAQRRDMLKSLSFLHKRNEDNET